MHHYMWLQIMAIWSASGAAKRRRKAGTDKQSEWGAWAASSCSPVMQPLEATAQITHAHCEYTERIRLGIL